MPTGTDISRLVDQASPDNRQQLQMQLGTEHQRLLHLNGKTTYMASPQEMVR